MITKSLRIALSLSTASLVPSCASRTQPAAHTVVAPVLSIDIRGPALPSLEQTETDHHDPEAVATVGTLDAQAFDLSEGLESNQTAPAPSEASNEPESPIEVRLFDVNAREWFALALRADGSITEEQRAALEQFFKCRRTGRTHAIAPGVLKVLYAIAARYEGRVIEVISAFRTYPYGVRDSKHYEGHALDLRVRGVSTNRVRDFVWSHFRDVGVGYYGHQNFVHVDYRPDEKDTAWTSPQPNAPYAYNPPWAMRIRPPWADPRPLRSSAANMTMVQL